MVRRFLVQIIICSFFIFFEASAGFQAKFYGGTWNNPNTNNGKVNSGTLFKTGLVTGNIFRFGGSFAYSQGTTSDTALVQGDSHLTPSNLCEDVEFVPEMIRVDRLLLGFDDNKHGVRVVVDEFGGFVGLIGAEAVLAVLAGWWGKSSKK